MTRHKNFGITEKSGRQGACDTKTALTQAKMMLERPHGPGYKHVYHTTHILPMSYTLGMAARATGFSKSTIYRAIKVGRVPAGRTGTGDWAIDRAELHRVFPPFEMDDDASGIVSVTGDSTAPAEAVEVALRNSRLEAELASSTLVTDLLRRQLEETRRDRDQWRGQAQRLVLAGPMTVAQSARLGFVARMFGFA